MAMNKAERKALEDALLERDMARALRWPEYERPVVIPPPSSYGEPTSGFLIIPSRSMTGSAGAGVVKAWSDTLMHGFDSDKPNRSFGIHGSSPLFATRIDALKGLRMELTEMFAKKLAEVDRLIAEEK